MSSPNPALLPLLLVTGLILLADQGLKFGILVLLDLDTRGVLVMIPDHLRLVMVWNRGINFGLLDSTAPLVRWGLVALTLLVVAVVVWQILRQASTRIIGVLAGLLCGGALGNAIDRVLHGAVVDYLNVACCGLTNPWVFNFADMAVFAGLAGLLYCWPQSAGETPGRNR